MEFIIRTDQQAPASIYNKKLLEELSDEISDIFVSTFCYKFMVEYVSSKNNLIADFLFRHRIWEEEFENGPEIDDFGRQIPIEAHVNSVQTIHKYEDRLHLDPLLEDIRHAGSLDDTYTEVIKALSRGPCIQNQTGW